MNSLAPREGSSLYYSVLWTESVAKERFLKRLAMIHELSGTLDDVSDADVAQRKIHWWHEEIERLIKGDARHPSFQSVSASLGGRRQCLRPLIDILSTAADNRFTPPSTDTDAHQRLQTDFQARLRLLAHALDLDDTTLALPSDALAPLALAFGQREQLTRLPRRLHQGYAVFSEQRYSRHELTPARLAEGIRGLSVSAETLADRPVDKVGDQAVIGTIGIARRNPGGNAGGDPAGAADDGTGRNTVDGSGGTTDDVLRKACLDQAVEETLAAFLTAEEDSSCQSFLAEPDHEPILILAQLYRAQMALWSRKQPDLLRERMTLTPVRKWFIAWRTHRARRS